MLQKREFLTGGEQEELAAEIGIECSGRAWRKNRHQRADSKESKKVLLRSMRVKQIVRSVQVKYLDIRNNPTA